MEDAAAVEEAPMPQAPPEDPAPAPAPTQPVKKKKKTKKVIMSSIEALTTFQEWEPEWLKAMTALIPGFSLDKDRDLDKAQTDMVAELREQQRENGYIEIEVTDDEDEEQVIRRAPTPNGRGRRRFRPGVCKKAGDAVKKLN